MFKSILSKVGFGELPSSFGFTVGEKVDVPFQWHWDLHKGLKKSDGSAVSVFVCGKKDLDMQQAGAAKNAVQMAKSLRHTNIVRALDSIEVDSGFYLVTEQVAPLLSQEVVDMYSDEKDPAVWGLYQALDALGFLHQSGFTHGLFGPASILVTPRGDFRLGVFDLCRKDADASAILAQRRRCGPGIMGWPDAPSYLQEGGSPTIGVDLWGAAVMAAYVFGSARAGRRGADYRVDVAKASQDLPAELRKQFAELVKPGPLKGRNPITELLQNPFFQQHSSVQVMSFLSSLHIRSTEEKDGFFENLPGLLDSTPHSLQTRQVLPELLEAQKFPGQEAAQVLPAILKIGIRLKDDDFKAKVAPLVAQLFAAPDRAVRFRLLTSLGEMIDHLDDHMINEKIFPECVNGFTDSNGPIREATVKSLIHFVPRLKAKTVEGRVVKLLVKLMQDPEASIRTNAIICCGRVSSGLPPGLANQTLATMLAAGFKDPFAPCRNASLQTLLATCSAFSTEELATKMMPGVCHRLMDPDQGVADSAFHALTTLHQHVRQQVEERRAQAAEGGGKQEEQAAPSADTSTWGTWAFSTVGSVVGNKLMGSMGPAKSSSDHLCNSTPTAAPPPPSQPASSPSAPQTSSGSRAASGMKLGSAASARPAAPATTAPATTAPGTAWGDDDDEDESPSATTASAAAWGGGGEDFWDEFGGVPEGSGGEESGPAVAAGPAPVPTKAAAAPKQAAPKQAARGMALPSTTAKAKAAPKPSAKALSSKEDDDFWKEFDM